MVRTFISPATWSDDRFRISPVFCRWPTPNIYCVYPISESTAACCHYVIVVIALALSRVSSCWQSGPLARCGMYVSQRVASYKWNCPSKMSKNDRADAGTRYSQRRRGSRRTATVLVVIRIAIAKSFTVAKVWQRDRILRDFFFALLFTLFSPSVLVTSSSFGAVCEKDDREEAKEPRAPCTGEQADDCMS